MKKMKPQSTQYCSYCKQRANWRTQNSAFMKYACDEHKHNVEVLDEKNNDDGSMSEGEWQAYGRFGY